jgi:peptidoglycan/xylan/chitin deacetylase (PgdA/CDA1 family)/glycosyltransferase involved in cell wall biosynthesis
VSVTAPRQSSVTLPGEYIGGVPYELSVVIASRGRATQLRSCIRALAQQSQSPDTFEVIVAPHGSNGTPAGSLVDAEQRFALRVVQPAVGGVSAALNAAVEAARGAVCVFLDEVVTADRQLLAEHAAAHRNDRRVIGVGRLAYHAAPRSDWYAREHAAAANRRADRLSERDLPWAECSRANMSISRAALLSVGGFATDLPAGEAEELAFRLCEAGWRPEYLPAARGEYALMERREALLEGREQFAAAAIALADRAPATLPSLLGWFQSATPREILLRRLFLSLRLPTAALLLAASLFRARARREAWFDLVATFAFWSAVRARVDRDRWRRLTRGVPVLMYHAFEQRGPGSRLIIPASRFRAHLRALALLGFRVVPLTDLVTALRERDLPSRAVAITIDDGYRDNAEIALPELGRRGCPATIFVVTSRLGEQNDWDAGELAGRPLLSAADTVQLRTAGIEVGAHTRSHANLRAIDDDQVPVEVADSRVELERSLGGPVALFSYPYGAYDDRSVAAARGAYLGACTTESRLVGLDSDPFLLPRLEVRGTDSPVRFLVRLAICRLM